MVLVADSVCIHKSSSVVDGSIVSSITKQNLDIDQENEKFLEITRTAAEIQQR
jgi:hypothetical protein